MKKINLTKQEALQLLSITPPYDEKQLKSAYRKAALLHHPDKGGSKETFIKVSDAYELLKNPSQNTNHIYPGGFGGFGTPFGSSEFNEILRNLMRDFEASSGYYDSLFGSGQQTREQENFYREQETQKQERRRKAQEELRKRAEERFKRVNLNDGEIPREPFTWKEIKCPSCNGSGYVLHQETEGNPLHYNTSWKLRDKYRCQACKGRGLVRHER